MHRFKEKIYKLYRMSAKLNLYFALCDVEKARVKKELSDILSLAEEIMKELQGMN